MKIFSSTGQGGTPRLTGLPNPSSSAHFQSTSNSLWEMLRETVPSTPLKASHQDLAGQLPALPAMLGQTGSPWSERPPGHENTFALFGPEPDHADVTARALCSSWGRRRAANQGGTYGLAPAVQVEAGGLRQCPCRGPQGVFWGASQGPHRALAAALPQHPGRQGITGG